MADLENKKVLQNIFGQSAGFKPLLFILLFIASTTWISTVIYDVFKNWDESATYWIFAIISTFIIYSLYSYMKKLIQTYSEEDKIDINQINEASHEVLILFLSDNKALPTKDDLKDENSINNWLDRGRCSWKMPAVSIKASHSTLKEIFVLTSNESREQFEPFCSVVNMLDKREFVITQKHINDMNNIEKYKATFHSIYEDCKQKEIKNIAIDITSGNKLYSIAGSYYGLSFDKIVQYVNQNDYSIHPFNNKIVVES